MDKNNELAYFSCPENIMQEQLMVFLMPVRYGLYPDGSRKLHVRMAEDCDPGELFLRILTGNEELRDGILDALSVYLASLSPEEAITKLNILQQSVNHIKERHLHSDTRAN